MALTPLAAGWKELFNTCEDGKDLQKALDCLKNSHPPQGYQHLHIRMLLRKMLPRMYDQNTCVRGVRVFWRAGATSDLDMAVFFFIRLRQANLKAYFMSVGVGTSVTVATISSELQALCTYMSNQPGGQLLIIVGSIIVPQQPQPEEYPVTLRPNLNTAFSNARAAQKLTYQHTTAPDPPPWPDALHFWQINP